ncbi:MAG: ABC transporter permease subunit [Candidatus Altiarchaeota archaeon]
MQVPPGALPYSKIAALCALALIIFVFVVFLPPVYVLTYAFSSKLAIDAAARTALINSFAIAAAVTFADLVFGMPVAWVLARRQLRFRGIIDSLLDMPLVVPTSVLGLSVYYFWGEGLGSLLGVEGGLFSKGPILIILLHVVFTFPYVVRSISAAILQVDTAHEQAATMLGGSPFTVYRAVSLPLFKNGVFSGAILAFTRSLSETGATMMVAGAFLSAPVMVVAFKNGGDIPSAAALSVVLIASAVAVLILAKLMVKGFKVPVVHVWPAQEKSLSRMHGPRDLAISAWVLIVVLLPTFYLVLTGMDTLTPGTFIGLLGDGVLIDSMVVSFVVGFVVTAVNLALSIPLGLVVSKDMFRVGQAVDTMSDVILIVPTSALGLSLALYWNGFGFGEYATLILAHLSFTFPLMLRPIVTALNGVSPQLEDAARTLGARQLTVFRTVTYPLIKPAIMAGVIMTFMRSLSETGATLSISKSIKTVPVLLVDQFSKGRVDEKTELACLLLFFISFALIIILKTFGSGKNAEHRG